MTKNSFIPLILIFSLIFLSGCKDKDIELIDRCKDLPEAENGQWYQFVNNEYGYSAPCFNPNDQNEISFIKKNFDTYTYTLCTKDLVSGEEKLLIDDVWYQPDWGVNGWIVFNRTDNLVWKIKSNGDSLTQLTYGEWCLYPVWSSDATQITFSRGDYFVFSDVNGVGVDSINYFDYGICSWAYAKWSVNNKIAFAYGTPDNYGICYIDADTKELVEVFLEPLKTNREIISSFSWTPADEIVYTNYDGIFIINMAGKRELIKSECDSKSYTFISVSGNGSKIITDKLIRSVLDENTLAGGWRISRIDISTHGETDVLR